MAASLSTSTKCIQATIKYIDLPSSRLDGIDDVVVGCARMVYASTVRVPFAMVGAVFHSAKFAINTLKFLANKDVQEWINAKNELCRGVEEAAHLVFSYSSWYLLGEIASFSLAPLPFAACCLVLAGCQSFNYRAIVSRSEIAQYQGKSWLDSGKEIFAL